MAETKLPTQDDLSNIASSLKGVTKALEKVSAQLLKQKKEVGGLEDKSKEILKLQDQHKKKGEEFGKTLRSLNDFASDLKNTASDILQSFGGFAGALGNLAITGFFTKAIKDSLTLNNQMTRLSWQLGFEGKNVKDLTGAVNNLQKEFGVSYDRASGLIRTLSEKRYVDNIYQAAAGIALFSKATGASDNQTANLADTLNKAAGMSTASINAMLAGMTGVQQRIGVTSDGMTTLVSQIGSAAVNMAAFGKSSDQIKAMAAQTTALVGSMEKVGIAAADTLQIVEKLTDPDKIEDNILLYSQLGVSIEDAISGNVDLSTMDGQLKDMAQRIVDMGPIAGSQFAKSMGMSYKQASQMAKMQGDEVAGVSEEASTAEDMALEKMKQMEDQSAGFLDKTEKAFNRLEGGIRSLGPAVLLVMGILLPKLLKNAVKSIGDFFSPKSPQMSIINEGVGSSVAAGVERGAEQAKEKMETLSKAIGRTIYLGVTPAISMITGDAQKGIDALVEKATGESPFQNWFNTKVQGELDTYRKNIIDLQREGEALQGSLAKLGVPKEVQGSLEKLSEYTQDVFDDKNADKDFQAALARIQKQMEANATATKGWQDKIDAVTGSKGMGELTVKLEEANQEVERTQSDLSAVQTAQAEISRLAEERGKTALHLADLQEKLKDASGDEYNALKAGANEAEKKLKSLEDSVKDQVKAAGLSEKDVRLAKTRRLSVADEKKIQDAIAKQLTKKAKAASDAVDDQKRLNTQLKKEGDLITENSKKRKSPFTKAVGAIGSSIKSKFFGTEFGKAVAASQAKSKEKGVKAGKEGKGGSFGGALARTAGKAAAKGIGKGALGIMKMLGPMAIVMAVLGKLIDKIKEPLQEMMDTIVDAMGPIVKAMMPVIKTLMETIATKILPPLLRVAAGIWQAIGTLVGKPLVAILRLLGKLPWLGGMFEGLADTVEKLTDGSVAESMIAAANQLEQISFDKKKENKESEESKPAEIKAKGASFEKVSDAKEGTKSADGQAASTTQTTTEKKPTDTAEKLEAQNEKKRQKKRDETFEELMKRMDATLTAMNNYWQDQADSLKNIDQKSASLNVESTEKPIII